MKTIQMTIAEPLLAEVERGVVELHTTRAACIRAALEVAPQDHHIRRLEERQAQGYARHPVTPGEFDLWADEQQWGAGAA